jgi:MFS family permease
MVEATAGPAPSARAGGQRLVIAGAALGTMFEWYDFFLYGSLAAYIARHFFAGVTETTGFILALAAFAAGFAVRPLGALVFGRIGDVVGRKNTFLVTMAMMGFATFFVGLLPGFDVLGPAAPVLLVVLRLLQGLALGGEYGGAAIYVAEHAPPGRRGQHTSWINAMATSGLILSLLVIIAVRLALPEGAFENWGWRIPFLVSAALLGVSLWVRLKLGESPVFAQMKAQSGVSKAPYAEAFGRWNNLKLVLVAMFGSVAAGTVIWYTAQFYTLFFLERLLKVEGVMSYLLIALSLAIATPAYVLLGWLSDRIGRKPILIAGAVLAALLIFPAFHALTQAANPALAEAQARAPIVLRADPETCSLQFDPVGANRFDSTGCDIAKAFLTRQGLNYRSVDLPAGAPAEVHIGARVIRPADPGGLSNAARAESAAAFQGEARAVLSELGYPNAADPQRINAPLIVLIVVGLALLSAMTYAPIAAFLVELFPARIRYTSLSLPYHLGTGWIGGFMPATAFAIVAATGDIYSGLWYPVIVTSVGALIGVFFLPETRGRPIEG